MDGTPAATLISTPLVRTSPQPTQILRPTNIRPPSPIHTPSLTAVPTFLTIPYDEINWMFYALTDHLPTMATGQGNLLSSIAFSSEGVAWVGSSAGLWRYKNGSWTAFLKRDGMLSNSARDVAVAPNGDVWIGSYEGTSHFDGETWRTHPLSNVKVVEVAPDGKIWVAHTVSTKLGKLNKGVSFFDDTDWQVYIDETDEIGVGLITFTLDGTAWFGTSTTGIVRLDGDVSTQFPLETFHSYPSSGGVCGLCVSAFGTAPDGTLWAMIASKGLVHFDGETWRTHPYYTDGGPKAIAVSEDRVWVGEVFGHVVAFMENGQWYTFSGLPFDKVYDIQISPSGAIWFATGDGLYIYKK